MLKAHQVVMTTLEKLVPSDHVYRKTKSLLNFKPILKKLAILKKDNGAKEYGIKNLFLCMLLQFMENLSDREMERFLAENNSAKWFREFGLIDKTPTYTLFTKVRTRIGCELIAEIFNEVRSQLKAKGYINEVFTFIDATALISKFNLWKEKDKSIQKGYEKLNNTNISKFSADKDARIGAKSKNKFWVGYKKHVSVDTQTGMINKVAITKANVPDAEGLKHVCPRSGMVIADKGYVGARNTIIAKGAYPAVILKNNMKEKNKDKDKWLTKLRSPYEGTFSKQNKRARYRGIIKNQMAEFLYAISFNIKKLIALES